MYDIAVLIGRFQPVHQAHLALLGQALAHARRVVVVLGSAHAARSVRNPFTWQERRDMLVASVSTADARRIRCVPVRDYYDEPVWAQAVIAAVAESAHSAGLASSVAAAAPSICLVGHFKDASSSYLRSFPDWALQETERLGSVDATPLREAWLAGAPASRWDSDLPDASRQFLLEFAQTPAFTRLHDERAALLQNRAAWAQAPYPPIFVTVDALVHTPSHVLLIRRGRAPGQGLLALPGGFIEPQETLLASCLRELEEETHCALSSQMLREALREVAVFAHPARSQRGRTITHVHRFALDAALQEALPEVRADDDAASAHWMPLAELAGMENQFFEDHFHVLDRMLGVLAISSNAGQVGA